VLSPAEPLAGILRVVPTADGPATLEDLYAKFAEDLIRFATGLVGPADAPDVVATAMLSCLRIPQWDSTRHHQHRPSGQMVGSAAAA
jgi:DNA-directed RNA polymerase specialized sigma24 family protein